LIAAGTRHLLINLEQAPHLNRIGILGIDHVLFSLLGNQSRDDRDAMYAGICAGTFLSPYLKLVNLSPRAQRALHTAGVDMYLEIHSDLNAAIASFSPSPQRPKQEVATVVRVRPIERLTPHSVLEACDSC
jgi:hypothetical protein